MAILADLKTEIENYPHEFLDIELIDVTPAQGNAVNKNETVTFKVQVTNRGPLHVNNLSLKLEGLNDTEIKEGNGAGAPWGTEYTSPAGYFPTVNAHQSNSPVVYPGSPLTFRPTRRFGNVTDLVRVSVAGWDTDLSHILTSHSRADEAAAGTYGAVVHPA